MKSNHRHISMASTIIDAEADARQAAHSAALTYTSDSKPGIRRKRAGRGFVYRDASGKIVRSAADLARIRMLVIPPAWVDVWICPSANGHLQATGRDVRGRKQYKYHARWRITRAETNFDRLASFGAILPRIRRRINRDLRLPGITKSKVLATVVRLLETTLIRVGNEEYARSNGSYGLTTFKNRHVHVQGSKMQFRFRGKSGKDHVVDVTNRRLARLVKRCQDLPGHDLFEYLDESGTAHDINSAEVNEYLRDISGNDFTAKDFRTWAGTLLATQFISTEKKPRPANLVRIVKQVAERLGNTPAVCRKSYIHPMILKDAANGTLTRRMHRANLTVSRKLARGLRDDEVSLLQVLNFAET
jgi:DNA topoisomerase I